MYSERDMNEIERKIRVDILVLAPVLAILLAAYIYAMVQRVNWLAIVAAPLMFVAACYGILAHLLPHARYRNFLRDIEKGLSRELRGRIIEVSDAAEPQDGAMVLPVRVKLDEDEARRKAAPVTSVESKRLGLGSADDVEDERIVYLNASKREGFPAPGTPVALKCFGRHIREVTII